MSDLRAEQIMDAVVALVTGLTTTDQNVRLNPIYDAKETNLPGIDVFEGADTNLSEEGATNTAFIDSDLNVHFKLIVKQSEDYVSKLNLIRKELEIAIMADHTLGLGFVITTIWVNKTRPELDKGDQPIATMEMNYIIRYRRSITDPSA